MSLATAAPHIVARRMETVIAAPSHWPPRPTRLSIAIRLGITRLLLERRP